MQQQPWPLPIKCKQQTSQAVTSKYASRHGQMGVGGGGGPKNHLWVRTTAARSKEGAVYLQGIYFFLVVLGLHCYAGFSLVAASGGYSSLRCGSFSSWWPLLLRALEHRLSSCGTRALFVAPRHVESSRTRDRTRVSCVGRRILYH